MNKVDCIVCGDVSINSLTVHNIHNEIMIVGFCNNHHDMLPALLSVLEFTEIFGKI